MNNFEGCQLPCVPKLTLVLLRVCKASKVVRKKYKQAIGAQWKSQRLGKSVERLQSEEALSPSSCAGESRAEEMEQDKVDHESFEPFPNDTLVYKNFPGHGWYWGKIKFYSDGWYRVVYLEDGDKEDAEHSDVELWAQQASDKQQCFTD